MSPMQVSAVLDQLCSAAAARGGLKDLRRYLAHGAGSKTASSYLGELTARVLSGHPVADMQHSAASLRCWTFPCHQPANHNAAISCKLSCFRMLLGMRNREG